MSKKGLGETVLGWFVVREDDDAAEPAAEGKPAAPPRADVAQYVAKGPPPPRPDETAPPSVRLPGTIPSVAPGARVDDATFQQVFDAAEIGQEERQRVEKALALLGSLPKETPVEVRKQIVEASLKAFGIPVDDIIETAAEEIQALEAFIQAGERQTQDVLTDANAQIAKHLAHIEEVKRLMELQVQAQETRRQASNQYKLRVQPVLEFFGADAVARVVHESPKLVEPKKK